MDIISISKYIGIGGVALILPFLILSKFLRKDKFSILSNIQTYYIYKYFLFIVAFISIFSFLGSYIIDFSSNSNNSIKIGDVKQGVNFANMGKGDNSKYTNNDIEIGNIEKGKNFGNIINGNNSYIGDKNLH